MKLLSSKKLFIGLVAAAMLLSGCELLDKAADKVDEVSTPTSNTDADGNVNGDENFNPDDAVSDNCHDMDTLAEEDAQDCVKEYKAAYNPGYLNGNCERLFESAFQAADMFVREGCMDKEPDMGRMEQEKPAACIDIMDKMDSRSKSFTNQCGKDVGDNFFFPWEKDDHDDHDDHNNHDDHDDHDDHNNHDDHDADYYDPMMDCDPMDKDCHDPMMDCDPMMKDCDDHGDHGDHDDHDDHGMDCDPMMKDCHKPMIDCDPMMKDCHEPDYDHEYDYDMECDSQFDDCYDYDYDDDYDPMMDCDSMMNCYEPMMELETFG